MLSASSGLSLLSGKVYLHDQVLSKDYSFLATPPTDPLSKVFNLLASLLKSLLLLFMLHNVTALYIRIIMVVSPLIVLALIRLCIRCFRQDNFNFRVFYKLFRWVGIYLEGFQ